MILKKLLSVVVLVLIMACSTSRKTIQNNPELDAMMQNREFKIEMNSMQPQVTQALSQIANSGLIQPGNTINRIDLTGSSHNITVIGDSITSDLPYFGERQMGGGYNSDTGIEFDGVPSEFEITKNEKDNSYNLDFTIDSSSETYFVNTKVFTNLSSVTDIRSTHRNWVRFMGTAVKPNQEE